MAPSTPIPQTHSQSAVNPPPPSSNSILSTRQFPLVAPPPPPPQPSSVLQAGVGMGTGGSGGHVVGAPVVGGLQVPQREREGTAVDTLSVNQLKAAAAIVKPKPTQYDYRYEDTDTLMAELDEFFSYSEVPSLGEGLEAFEKDFKGDWLETTSEEKIAFISKILKEQLLSDDVAVRTEGILKLNYTVEGTFAETNSPEHQLHFILDNCKLVKNAGGLTAIIDALVKASAILDRLVTGHTRSDSIAYASNPPNADNKLEAEAIYQEIGLYLSALYFLIESSRGDDALATTLMACEPPFPVFLMQLLGGLKDRFLNSQNSKGYPIKRLLLLTWKVTLACFGGLRDVAKVTKFAREVAGLPSAKEDWLGFTKSSPHDIRQFRSETSVKYPTFSPPPFSDGIAPASKLAEALSPIPVRPHYHSSVPPSSSDNFTSLGRPFDFTTGAPSFGGVSSGPNGGPAGGPNGFPGGGLPMTPAPSPPPSPKPKKQQWQTDPARPFIFPFSHQAHGPDVLVPFAISEADALYRNHIHVPLSLYQLYQEREDFIRDEIGLGRDGLLGMGVENKGKGEVVLDENGEEVEDDGDEVMREFRTREWDLREEMGECERNGDSKGAKKVQEKKESLKKLERVEILYRGVLSSSLASSVVVLLKQVLSSLPQPPLNNQQNNFAHSASPNGQTDGDGFEFPSENEAKPPPTLAEVDLLREREINSKAVSAMILLLLKWFKCSHILKFQHLSQILFDMNCPLILVKTFLLQDSVELVQAKNEVPDHNFFRYCLLNHSRHPHPSTNLSPPTNPDDPSSSLSSGEAARPPNPRTATRFGLAHNKPPGTKDDEEVELISDYSARNFFSSINRIKIIQKLLKGRTQQIHQFNQYKTFNTFKRMLKVQHPMFQLQVLKIIKGQIPHLGKKWKQQNMKIVTAIYLNCRPDLRDEWLTAGMEQDELDESNAQEQALRSLVRFYHNKHYSSFLPHPTHLNAGPSGHRHSLSLGPNADLASSSHPPPPGGHHRNSSVDVDLFPPNKSHPPSSHSPASLLNAAHHPGEEHGDNWSMEYEDVLDDVFGDGGRGGDDGGNWGWGSLRDALKGLGGGGEGGGGEWGDDWSDVSSIATIGELGDEARLGDGGPESESESEGEVGEGNRGVSEGDGKGDEDEDGERDGEEIDENKNNWEHMSNATLAAMPRSPTHIPRRSSSGGSPLRPVMKGNGVDGDMYEESVEVEEELGPAPISGPGGGGVDEVEFMYGE